MKVTSSIRSQVLRLAHQARRIEKLSFSEAQIQAWKIYRVLVDQAENGEATFSYVKVSSDGQTVREAKGTFSSEAIYQSKKGHLLVRYWDTEVQGARQFYLTHLI